MLLSKEISQVAEDLGTEAKMRPYVRALIPSVIDDNDFWRLIIELVEIVLHRRGYVVVRREIVQGEGAVRPR